MQKILLVLVAGLLIIVFALFSRQQLQSEKETVSPTSFPRNMQTFYSMLWSFSIEVPDSYQILEKNTFIELFKNDGKKITVVKNGTNFDNLEDYLQEFDSRRKIRSSDEKMLRIDNMDAIVRIDTFPDVGVTQKAYYIYTGYMVYILSTEDTQLYNDLDQIAQSFRYTP
jgi:hypothetical protein